mmetsp:Transcript_43082/g.78333  ORF Transcript_43082/g.78333 Transcript_43082/m.78333 type:complete len:210 (-) Transcript_43082:276-905(-)
MFRCVVGETSASGMSLSSSSRRARRRSALALAAMDGCPVPELISLPFRNICTVLSFCTKESPPSDMLLTDACLVQASVMLADMQAASSAYVQSPSWFFCTTFIICLAKTRVAISFPNLLSMITKSSSKSIMWSPLASAFSKNRSNFSLVTLPDSSAAANFNQACLQKNATKHGKAGCPASSGGMFSGYCDAYSLRMGFFRTTYASTTIR